MPLMLDRRRRHQPQALLALVRFFSLITVIIGVLGCGSATDSRKDDARLNDGGQSAVESFSDSSKLSDVGPSLRIARLLPGTRFMWRTTSTAPGNVSGETPFTGKRTMSVSSDESSESNVGGVRHLLVLDYESVDADFNTGVTSQTTYRSINKITQFPNGESRTTSTEFLVGRLGGVHKVIESTELQTVVEPGSSISERIVYDSGMVVETETTYGKVVRHTSSLGTFTCIEFNSTTSMSGVGTSSTSGLFCPELGVSVTYSLDGSNGYSQSYELVEIVRPEG